MTDRPVRQLWAGIAALLVLVALLAGATAVLSPDLGGDGAPAAGPASSTPHPDPATASARPKTSTPPATPVRSCRKGPAPAPGHPATRDSVQVVNIGFEDLTSDDPDRLRVLAAKLDEVAATGVRIAVGRLDWIAFPWAGHRDIESGDVLDTGRDYVAEAIAALGCDRNGARRDIYLGIDVLFGREFTQRPGLAGVNQAGKRSDLFASVTAWKSGALTRRLADLAHELAVRYSPEAVNVTELMFDNDTFGPDDLADFKATQRAAAWPRSADGTIDRDDRRLQQWRTDALVSVVAQVKRRLAPTGVALTLDVRSPVTYDPVGRPDIGQSYPRLLEHVDRLVVWDFPGIASSGVFGAAQLGPLLFARAPDRYELEIGLWKGRGIIPVSTLQRELRAARAQGIRSVSVTPASLFSEPVWTVLQREWARPG
ncbi:hypothetical protein [Intrasporangium sp.]|uniref:hypothetical protein n=1 Tax=Intrasporangium sp. TaxID=1925024 RepID=UPI0032216096